MTFPTPYPDTEVVVPSQLPAGPAATLLNGLLDGWVMLPEEWEETPGDVRTSWPPCRPRTRSWPGWWIAACSPGSRPTLSARVSAVRAGARASTGCWSRSAAAGWGRCTGPSTSTCAAQVAVKVMSRSIGANPRLLHRFYAEARAVARLQHPNIVACLDAGRHQPARRSAPRLLRDGADPRAATSRTPSGDAARCRRAGCATCSARWPRRWPRRTGTGWSTATSSRPTSSSPRTGRRSCSTSGWPGSPPHRTDRAGHAARHGRVHGPGAGQRPARGGRPGRPVQPRGDHVLGADRPRAVPGDRATCCATCTAG